METRLREQLSETERRLTEARREHAKAGEVSGVQVGFQGEGCVETGEYLLMKRFCKASFEVRR